MKNIVLIALLLVGCDRSYQYKVCEVSPGAKGWTCTTPTTKTGGRWNKPTATRVECIQAGGFSWRCQTPYNLPDSEGKVYLLP